MGEVYAVGDRVSGCLITSIDIPNDGPFEGRSVITFGNSDRQNRVVMPASMGLTKCEGVERMVADWVARG